MVRLSSIVLVLILMLGACSSDTAPTGTPTTTAGSVSPSATADPSDEPTGTTSSSGSNGIGGGATDEPSETPSTQAPEPAEPTAPAAPGTYRYSQSGQTRYGLFAFSPDPEGTLQIDDAAGPARARTQRQLRTYSDSHTQESWFVYRADRVVLERTTTTIAGQQQSCDAPLTVLELPLKVGSAWSDEGSCDGLTVTLEAVVDRRAQRDVGGTAVDTFVVKYVIKVRGDDIRQTTRSTVWLSPDHRLIVRSVEETTGTVSGSEFTSNRTEDLLSITPD